jgi:hypothetical protein
MQITSRLFVRAPLRILRTRPEPSCPAGRRRAVTLADQPVHLKVSGLAPRQKVTVTSTAVDYERGQWRGQAIFRAEGRGVVSLDQARPISGSYQGVDGMGLFCSHLGLFHRSRP